MTTLKNLKGTAIQFLDADPVEYVGSWSSGGSVNTARQYGAGIGSSTAGLIFGGSSPPVVANTEQYNGTAWTEVNDLNAAQNAQGSAGTLTSGMSALGAALPGANVEDWNGTVWAANPHSLNSARQFPGGDGASNDAAIMVGGEPAPNGALTEIYNGSSWTESGDLNTARNQLAAAGTVTALIAMGGNTGADAETFNGSAWTAVTDMNSGRGGLSGSGTSTLALAFAGNPDVASTESWNGSAWTEVNDLSTGREFGASSNITGNTTAFLASGNTTTLVSNTEEWSFPPVTATTLNEGDMWFNSTSSTLKGYQLSTPTGTWASGGSLNTARQQLGASGTQTAGLGFGGSTGSVSALNEEYNGTSWTEKADLNAAKTLGAGTPAGTTTAALFFGGFVTDNVATNESWNGTAWSEQNDLNQARRGIGGAGTQTAALGFMGQTPGDSANTETWNGTSWTEVNNLNTARGSGGGAGTQTAALCSGGYAPGGNTGVTEKWDGTSWTETGDLNTARNELEQAGSQNLMLAFGGAPSSGTAATEVFNGTSWTELNDLSTARFSVAGIGSSALALAGGGSTGSVTAATEEWTADAALSTVTVS
jgi:hypothetical protein